MGCCRGSSTQCPGEEETAANFRHNYCSCSMFNCRTFSHNLVSLLLPVILLSQGEPGLATLIEELVKAAKKETPQARAAAMGLLLAMCSGSSVDLTEHVPHLIIFVTEAFNDPSESVCERAWLSLEALVKVRASTPSHHSCINSYIQSMFL